MQVEEIIKEASKLSEEERRTIVSRLLSGLKRTHHWVDDEEVMRRMQEAEDDPSVLISLDEFRSAFES